MVDAQGARGAHVRAQRGDEVLVGGLSQLLRLERKQPPVLALRAERVRGRANANVARGHLLLDPGVGAVGVDAHGEVAIDAQAHAVQSRASLGRLELKIGLPLKVLEEADPLGAMPREQRHLLRGGIAIGRGPGLPGPVSEELHQRLKHRKATQAFATLRLEAAKRSGPLGAAHQMGAEEGSVEPLQHFPLQRGDLRVVDEFAGAHRRQPRAKGVGADQVSRRLTLRKIRNRHHIQVQRIELRAAARRVGADPLGVRGKQGVQRVDGERRCTQLPGCFQQIREVAQVSDSPVLWGAQRVKLGRDSPAPLSLGQLAREIAAGGSHDQLQRRGSVGERQLQRVIARRNSERKLDRSAFQLDSIHLPGPDLRRIGGPEAPLSTRTPFLDERPLGLPVDLRGGQHQRNLGDLRLAQHQNRRQRTPPGFRLQRGHTRLDRRALLHREPERRQDCSLRLGRDLVDDLVLAMGHSSPEEGLILLPEARRLGVRHILITHVLGQNPTREQMRSMASGGAVMELDWYAVYQDRRTVEEYVSVITDIGAEHLLISSDLGQQGSPSHPDGLRAFVAALRDAGISNLDIDAMARDNPARLLGLNP